MQKLAEICLKRPVFAVMLTLALVVVGGFSFLGLGVDLFPKIDLPVITVTVANPGSSPQEIEQQISKKLEDAVNTISGIDEIRTNSVEGLSLCFITFELEKNSDTAAQEVRDKVNLITGLPTTALSPIIQKLDPGAAPVLQIALSADRPLEEVTRTAELQIIPQLEGVDGVGQVQVIGGAKQNISIIVDPERMRARGITVAEITGALRTQDLEMPGGHVDEGARELTVRTMGRIRREQSFSEITVADRGGHAVKLSEVADVVQGSAEQRTASKLDAKPALTLVISKQSGQNTIAVADEVKRRFVEIKQSLPADFRVEIVSDQSVFIKAAVEAIETHLIEGGLLAALLVFLFLRNWRSTFIAAIAIPTSLIATFGMMNAVGYTLNQVTMLALTLMIGIVIDDAIVVLENIYRFMEEKGMDPMQASIEGTREIGLAVLATTLSLMAVFLPVAFMKGIVGRIMSSFGLTSAFAIGVSLFVSFSLTPMLCSRLIRRKSTDDKGGQPASKSSGFYARVERRYMSMLEWSMLHRWTVVAICGAVVLSTVPLFMLVGKNFTPTDDQSAFSVSLRAPEGSTLSSTSLLSERMSRDLRGLPGVTDTLSTVGGGQEQQVNRASIFVKLAPLGQREGQAELISRARDLLSKYPKSLHISVGPIAVTSSLGGSSSDVQYVIRGPDLNKLAAYSSALLAKMEKLPTAVDVDTSLITGKPELRVQIDRDQAADLGVSISDVAQSLNVLVASQEVSRFDSGRNEYPVRIQAAREYRSSEEGLRRMVVSSSRLGIVGLDSVAHIEEGTGPASIERLTRQRQVTLSANVKAGGSQAALLSQISALLPGLKLEPGYTAGPAGASRELGRAAYYFLLAIALSFIFMYMVLASQFESFVQPVIILMTLPLSVPCGVLSLLVFGQSMNVFAGLGLLLLFGVVKKNAILQLDHTNHLRTQGFTRYDAIMQANRDRLRPILMTTLALVAGMLPLVLSNGAGSATNRSIGVMVIGGQSLCLLLTLLAVPVFYSIVDDMAEANLWQRLVRRMSGSSAVKAQA
jgi:hydrophobic/amphiphilic exporter-1 (mainly G- bacteria), HAE1 family